MLEVEFESKDELLERCKKAASCLQCSLCAFECVVTKYFYEDDNTFVYDLFSEEAERNPHIWECLTCHKCALVCPNDFDPPELIQSLKERAFEKGYAPPSIYAEVESILTQGVAFQISSASKSLRAKLDLPDLKIDASDLRKLAQKTGLGEKIKELKGKRRAR